MVCPGLSYEIITGTENEPTAESSLDDFSKDARVTDLDNDPEQDHRGVT
jgi:hypothetical protein